MFKVTFVSKADYGTSTLLLLKTKHHLKDYIKHKKEEKKKAEEPRVVCGLDATRIEYVQIPPKYKTICRKKRAKTCKIVYEWGEQLSRKSDMKDMIQPELELSDNVYVQQGQKAIFFPASGNQCTVTVTYPMSQRGGSRQFSHIVSEEVYEDSCSKDYYKRCQKWRADHHAGKDLLRPQVEKDLLSPGQSDEDYYEPYDTYSNDYYDDDRVPLPPVIQNGRYKDELRNRDYSYGWSGRPLPQKKPDNLRRGHGTLAPPGLRHQHAIPRPPRLLRGKRKVFEPDPGILFEPKPDIFDKPLFPPPRKKSSGNKLNENDGEEEISERHKIPLPFDQFRRFLQRDSFADGGFGSNLMNSQPQFDLGNFKEEMSVDLVAERVDTSGKRRFRRFVDQDWDEYDECLKVRLQLKWLII